MLLPSHCAQVFGSNKKGVQAFSFMFSCFGFSSIAGGLLTNFILENNYGYSTIFSVAVAMNVLSIIILVSYQNLSKEPAPQQPKVNWGWS